MKEKLEEIFNSISCLCGEGPEFMTRIEICEAVQKEILKGIKTPQRGKALCMFVGVQWRPRDNGNECPCCEQKIKA